MQFAVPQFTEVEDRLIGSLTLKQFLVLLGAGGVILFIWSVLGPSFIFFILAVPIGIFGLGAALGKYNGRPLFTYLIPFAGFVSSTKIMVFKRETNVTSVSRSEPIETEAPKLNAAELEPAESRLKKLAYLLDRKSEEEGDIISHDPAKAIQVSMPQMNLTRDLSKTASSVKEQILETAKKLDLTELNFVQPKSIVTTSDTAMTSKPKAVKKLAKISKPTPTFKPPASARRSDKKNFDPSSFLQI